MSQKALLITEPKGALQLSTAPKPTAGKGELLVKNVAVALNPVEWKQIAYNFWIPSYPYVLGVDHAGIVEEVGEEVTNFKKGDRIFAYSFPGADKKFGAFQEYSILLASLCGKIPDNISFSEAATLPLGSITSLCGIFYDLKIPTPFLGPQTNNLPSDTILIWGGSSSVGAYALQLARLTGFKNILTTASPHNFDYVKSLGATHAFDYKDPDVVKKIREASGGKLKLIYDATGAGNVLLETLGSEGGSIALTVPQSTPKNPPSNVKIYNTFAGVIFQNKEGEKLAQEFYQAVVGWLASGKYKPNIVQKLPKGLAGVQEGLDLLKAGKVSGKKLVVLLEETP
jgi:NADPH:quinone reductase-like Zn-dependent oxidoreductase